MLQASLLRTLVLSRVLFNHLQKLTNPIIQLTMAQKQIKAPTKPVSTKSQLH